MMGLRKTAIATILELMDTQRKALLDGDLERLSKIEAPLGRALVQLKKNRPTQSELEQVTAHAGRNAILIKAAQEGVASARAQISARHSTGFTTYDAQGRSCARQAGPARTISRR